jgi:hypothetical protein
MMTWDEYAASRKPYRLTSEQMNNSQMAVWFQNAVTSERWQMMALDNNLWQRFVRWVLYRSRWLPTPEVALRYWNRQARDAYLLKLALRALKARRVICPGCGDPIERHDETIDGMHSQCAEAGAEVGYADCDLW